MPGPVPIGPRRAGALVAGAAGMVVCWLVTMNAGLSWGLVLLAGVAGMGLLGIAVTYLELRRQHRLAGVREAVLADRWRAHEAQLRALRSAAARDHTVLAARLDGLARAQQQAAAAAAWRVAQPHPAGTAQRHCRDQELALLQASELFDPDWYRAQAGLPMPDPVAHYLDWGAALGIDPHPLFAAARYLERYPEALAQWRTPLAHFLAAERDPTVTFAPPTVRYDEHGNPDQADLKWEYLARGLHRQPDTFMLYRIIGNDLPPRHRAGQGIENLRFVLKHEPELPGCQKRWVVNRIIDPRIEKQVIALLEEHGRDYLHLPFEPDQYRKVGWRFSGLEPPGLTYRREFAMLNPNQRQRALDHVYHFKNLYVMNNNGSRNAALRQGRGLAKWVLPWDGNCFLTRAAWDELVAAVTSRPHLKYFTVPMARVLDNQALLRPDPIVDASEEPQLLFRRDAAEEFDPHARYGRRPKVELFYRLGIPGPWDEWGRVPWDDPSLARSPEAGQVGQAGWVARLFSGQVNLETHSADRQWRRIDAIRECIDNVDRDLAADCYDPAALFGRDEGVLKRQRAQWVDGESGPERVVGQLVQRAEQALRTRAGGTPPAVVERVSVAALAGWFTRQDRFFTGSADALRAGLLRRLGPMSMRRQGPRFDLTGARDIAGLLDAARLLEREQVLRPAEVARLRGWCGEYRRWLSNSEPGSDARAALDDHGTWYDVQLAALEAYLGDLGALLATLRRAHERVGQQFGHNGAPATPYQLLGWVRLAGYATRLGQDLWSHQGPGGQSLAGAVRRLLDRRSQPGRDADRRAVLAHLAAPHLTDLPLPDIVDSSRRDPWQLPPVFDFDAGVQPFWLLGNN